jgi:hypothetical protein
MEITKLDDLNSSNQKAPDVKLAILTQIKTRNKSGFSRFSARIKPFKPVLATITENIECESLEEEIAKLSVDLAKANSVANVLSEKVSNLLAENKNLADQLFQNRKVNFGPDIQHLLASKDTGRLTGIQKEVVSSHIKKHSLKRMRERNQELQKLHDQFILNYKYDREYPEPVIPELSEDMSDKTIENSLIDPNIFLDEVESNLSRPELRVQELSFRELIDKMSDKYLSFSSTMENEEGDQGVACPSTEPSRVSDWLTQQDFNLEPIPTETNLETIPTETNLETIPTETNQTDGLKWITLKMIESASIPKNCFVTLQAKGKSNHGKKFQTKTISTRNSDWNEPFSFYVDNTENCVISVKVKKLSLLGVKSSTIHSSHTFLSDLINGTTHNLLADLKAEVEIKQVLQENQLDTAQMKRNQRKSKAKLILREITLGIDPLHTITFGPNAIKFVLGQNKKESLEKPQKRSQDFFTRLPTWISSLHPKNRYTTRHFE